MSSMRHKESVSMPSMCHAFSVLIHANYVSDEGTLPCHLNVMRTHPYASYLSCLNLCVKQSHPGGAILPERYIGIISARRRKDMMPFVSKKEPTQSSAPQKMMSSSRNEEEFIYRIFRGTSKRSSSGPHLPAYAFLVRFRSPATPPDS